MRACLDGGQDGLLCLPDCARDVDSGSRLSVVGAYRTSIYLIYYKTFVLLRIIPWVAIGWREGPGCLIYLVHCTASPHPPPTQTMNVWGRHSHTAKLALDRLRILNHFLSFLSTAFVGFLSITAPLRKERYFFYLPLRSVLYNSTRNGRICDILSRVFDYTLVQIGGKLGQCSNETGLVISSFRTLTSLNP